MAKPAAGGRRPKRRERKNVAYGTAHIKSSFNNTVITITDVAGNTITPLPSWTVTSLQPTSLSIGVSPALVGAGSGAVVTGTAVGLDGALRLGVQHHRGGRRLHHHHRRFESERAITRLHRVRALHPGGQRERHGQHHGHGSG